MPRSKRFDLMGPFAQPAAAPVPLHVPGLSTPVVAAPAVLVAAAAIHPVGRGAEGDRIPPDLEKHITKVCSQLEKQVFRFLRNKGLLVVGAEQLKVLDEPGASR